MPYKELFAIADAMEFENGRYLKSKTKEAFDLLHEATTTIGRAWSRSWLGYQAYVYYADLKEPPAGAHFSVEWGTEKMIGNMGSRGDWLEVNPRELTDHILELAGKPDLQLSEAVVSSVSEKFETARANSLSILQAFSSLEEDAFLDDQKSEIRDLKHLSIEEVINALKPAGQIMSRDALAVSQGFRVPPHIALEAVFLRAENLVESCRSLAKACRKAASHMERLANKTASSIRLGTNIFIGHGRSSVWRDLKDFLHDRLKLPWDEFNRLPIAGVSNQARLSEMMDAAAFAFLVMTAEDETSEGEMQARMNVVHEVGLFQGRLGFTKAIILLEEGCNEFSNIQGIGQIRFPVGNISAKFEEIREVLEREEVLSQS